MKNTFHHLFMAPLDVPKSRQEMMDLIKMTIVSPEIASELPDLSVLEYDERGHLASAYEVDDLMEKHSISLADEIIGMPYEEHPPHVPQVLIKSPVPTGITIGGTNETITLPNSGPISVPFQYIGKVRRNTPELFWLPFEELEIIYPLLSTIDGYIFLDYTKPDAPVLLEVAGAIYNEDYYKDWPISARLQYKEVHLQSISLKMAQDAEERGEYLEEFGNLGIPYWQQDYQLPYCPKSGRLMKLIASFTTYGSIPLLHSDYQFSDPSKNNNIAHLSFWGSGTLNIFMEPETKIVGMIVQGS
ncbi:hypothetical protein [Lewinella sp. W8]|uniref:hypothetical protein n=1 Tax=Lewinella sp. W8 TaxID=2528208 RepID=UPI001068C83E|nr:hypothetical protein [Lewinella sp. W8]MTB52759.1 hypothetical protein [Lewinella sp. W8]